MQLFCPNTLPPFSICSLHFGYKKTLGLFPTLKNDMLPIYLHWNFSQYIYSSKLSDFVWWKIWQIGFFFQFDHLLLRFTDLLASRYLHIWWGIHLILSWSKNKTSVFDFTLLLGLAAFLDQTLTYRLPTKDSAESL